jgi:hypothetical protein
MDGVGCRRVIHNFNEKLAFSQGQRQVCDVDTIRVMLPGCVSIVKTTPDVDRTGIDYVATLRSGAAVNIDAKNRDRGCSKFWDAEPTGAKIPELSLEIYSVLPGGKYKTPTERKKCGWTLNEASLVDLILFQFAPEDCDSAYLIGFQPLRMAMVHNYREWCQKFMNPRDQDSGWWESRCLFVPVMEVLYAITQVCELKRSRRSTMSEASA